MKKYSILFIALCLVMNANAQKWKIGATLSPVLSKYIYADDVVSKFPEIYTKYGVGMSAGINFYRLYGKNFSIKTGLLINNKNFKTNVHLLDTNYFEVKESIYALTLPLMFQYQFKIKNNQFFVNSGFELSWLFKSVSKAGEDKYLSKYSSWKGIYEIYFGVGYMFNLGEKHSIFINPEYSPQFFTDDYSTFRLNIGIIFNNQNAN